MAIENAEVARLFRELADVLEIEAANPFRVRAYRNAARTVEALPVPVGDLAETGAERLQELPGIGADLAGKIMEIVRTGGLAALRTAERRVPKGLTEILQVPGLGPKRAQRLHQELGITSISQLRSALHAGSVREISGFGPASEARLLRAVAARAADEDRMLRPVAAQYGQNLIEYLHRVPGVRHVELAGSFRRCRETVGDLDLLALCGAPSPIVDHFVNYPAVGEILAQGSTKASVRLRSGLQVDLRVLPEESYGAALHYFTGSKAHNIAIRRMGQSRGLKINEYGVFRGAQRIGGRTETEVFGAVGLPYIPPELREDRGEIEAAARDHLPRLVDRKQIRGDLQSHTTDSDGRDTLEAMAEAAEELGYEYLAISDHSPAVRVAGGLDRAGFQRQTKRIDRLNTRLRHLTLLKGAEVDILADGSLDLDRDTRAALDLVIISVHSKFDLPKREQTRRMITALSSASVHILGHPTGRLLGRRPGMRLDLDQVIGAAVDHGVALEVNGQPQRLDLDDASCRMALQAGARIAISTDAHSTAELAFMRWGVEQARRGWAAAQNVLNCLPLNRLLKTLAR
jgi:DNA polymerase (family 10)